MLLFFFFFFKQKTAYEMVRSDWSSDVCSSDLPGPASSHLLSLVGRRDDSRRSVRRSRHPHETRKSHIYYPGNPGTALRFAAGACDGGDPGGCYTLARLAEDRGDAGEAATQYARACQDRKSVV